MATSDDVSSMMSSEGTEFEQILTENAKTLLKFGMCLIR